MGLTDRVLAGIAKKLELPQDVVAGVPRMVLIGQEEFQIEPHDGLCEYSQTVIRIRSKTGIISVNGHALSIKLMNQSNMIVAGKISSISVSGGSDD